MTDLWTLQLLAVDSKLIINVMKVSNVIVVATL